MNLTDQEGRALRRLQKKVLDTVMDFDNWHDRNLPDDLLTEIVVSIRSWGAAGTAE